MALDFNEEKAQCQAQKALYKGYWEAIGVRWKAPKNLFSTKAVNVPENFPGGSHPHNLSVKIAAFKNKLPFSPV